MQLMQTFFGSSRPGDLKYHLTALMGFAKRMTQQQMEQK